jgi:hypothetical protein
MLDNNFQENGNKCHRFIINNYYELIKLEDQINFVKDWSYKAKGNLILMAIGGIPATNPILKN